MVLTATNVFTILLANPNLVASAVPVKYIQNAGRLSITLRLKVISQTYTYRGGLQIQFNANETK